MFLFIRPQLFIFVLLLVSLTATGQTLTPQADRIAAQPKLKPSTRLKGHTPVWANSLTNTSAVPEETPLQLTFTLTRSAERQAAFEHMLADQQTPGSPNYHHWLTPQQIGDQYGPTQHDLDALTGWLASQGLRVIDVAPSRTFVTTEAVAGVVANALQTSFHNVSMRGRDGTMTSHLAATDDPSVPAALSPLIAAIEGLNDTPVEPMSHMEVVPAPQSTESPQLTASNGAHFVTPGDFAILYDVNAVYSSGYTGTGQKVAIIGRSRVNSADISAYQTLIGQTVKQPNVIIPPTGSDPGLSADQGEQTLDVQRVLGTAPGAQADLIISTSLLTPIQYNVQTLVDPVMTISYGACEALVSASSVSTYATLFSQAAAEGISVFVSSGDSGAAGCNSHGSAPPAAQFASINYLCSSSYVTCVGGTEFADTANPAAYWSASNTTSKVSVLSYIPEGSWNDPTDSSGNPIVTATGGGASIYIPKPPFQKGNGVPADGARDTPDISFSAARHDPYFGCLAGTGGGSCVPDPTTGAYSFVGFSGTSASAPSMAAVTALLNQKLAGAQGNLNPLIYRLAASKPTAFHDTTVASSGVSSCTTSVPSMCNNSTPSPSGLTGGLAGYLVTTGFDLSTGWGSLDVLNFLNAAALSPSTGASTSLAVSESATSINLGQSVSFTATLTAPTTGTPTGTVQFYANTTALGSPVPLSGTKKVMATLPVNIAGNLLITAIYSGDTTFAASTSTAVSLTVAGQATKTVLTPALSSVGVGVADALTASVTSTGAGTVIPTGIIEFVQGSTLLASVPLTNGTASTSVSFTTAGTASVTAYYLGDTTFASSNSAPASITVTPASLSYQISANPTSLSFTAGASSGNTSMITATPGGGFTGTVNLACAVTYNGTGTSTLPPTCSFSSSALAVTGTATSAILTLATTFPHAITGTQFVSQGADQLPWVLPSGRTLLAGLLLCFLPRRRRVSWKAMSMIAFFGGALVSLSGCGGSKASTPPTPVGTTTGSYTITVTASSTVSGVAAPAPLTIALTVN